MKITDLPDGPVGAILFVSVVALGGLIIMNILPAMSLWDRHQARRERQRAEDREVVAKLDAMSDGTKLFKR